ncbi:hypothetical protein KR009_009221, partial [Drosophila setifemur]
AQDGENDQKVEFLFDAVVTQLEVYSSSVKNPAALMVAVKFAGETMKITPSRLNVSDFGDNKSIYIVDNPSAIRDRLAADGMLVTLRYDGSTLGSGVIFFPDEFVDKIGPIMHDLPFEGPVSLLRRADCIGTATVRVLLIVKCEPSPVAETPRGPSVVSPRMSLVPEPPPAEKEKLQDCTALGPTINEPDIMFVIGDPDPVLKIPSEPCSELPPEEGDPRLDLDLARYKSLQNRRVIFPDDDPCPKIKPSFTALKELTKHYSKIIDSVAEKVRNMQVHVDPPSEKAEIQFETPLDKIKQERWIPVTMRPHDEFGIEPIRYCPVCLCSMSWLPKYMPCPQCKTQPRIVLEGHPTRELTADDVMAEILVKPEAQPGAEDFCTHPCSDKLKEHREEHPQSDDECIPCRCTCKEGLMCAHCRTREICADIFYREPVDELKTRNTIKAPDPGSTEDFCVIPKSEDDFRPYLSRVFSEMNSLYRLHDSKKLEALRKRCEQQSLLNLRTKQTKSTAASPTMQQEHISGVLGMHPRMMAGHKNCLPPDSFVPRNHGWGWMKSFEARKLGWRPGAILRTAGHVMRFFLMARQDMAKTIMDDVEKREKMGQPVLNVCKRFGEIYITLRPLGTLDMNQKPIIFRIVKSDLAVALREMKRSLKEQGFRKCTCHKSLLMCVCRDAVEKFQLNKALKKECQKRLMEPCPEHLVLTDTSDSEMEFDLVVTPPAGTRKMRKILRKTINHSTQTGGTKDLEIAPKYPVPNYYRAYDCAAGDRYMGTAFGQNEEAVFEDGVFGVAGGGPHGLHP